MQSWCKGPFMELWKMWYVFMCMFVNVDLTSPKMEVTI